MHFYAQINNDGTVVGISQLSGKVDAPDMIEIAEYDTIILGEWYNADTGEFTEPEPQEPTDPEPEEPTEQDIINAELLLGQMHLIESNAAIEETAALILLETVGGGL